MRSRQTQQDPGPCPQFPPNTTACTRTGHNPRRAPSASRSGRHLRACHLCGHTFWALLWGLGAPSGEGRETCPGSGEARAAKSKSQTREEAAGSAHVGPSPRGCSGEPGCADTALSLPPRAWGQGGPVQN